ncbi:hypothetical protein [Floricoccus penangensis]|uniref:hypothetical protein n=1 Tax=Floricoccus penangensis TaxID=1859475 RepID=UPI0020404920|nr:hypothetical protein [Floricoccus penangensis]URZ87138.1 hypothetical protein KIW23_08640 [Floricoccus penangensis]
MTNKKNNEASNDDFSKEFDEIFGFDEFKEDGKYNSTTSEIQENAVKKPINVENKADGEKKINFHVNAKKKNNRNQKKD